MAVALTALVMAAGGTAVAAGVPATIAKLAGLNSKQKGQATTIANTQIKKKASGLHVSYAATAGTAKTATTAVSAGTALTAGSATTAGTAANAANATNATNATNAGNSNTVDGQTVTKINANIADGATDQVFSSDSLTIVVTCISDISAINLSGPTDAEMNWSGFGGSAFGGTEDGFSSTGPTDITSGADEGVTTFAYSTYASNLEVTGTLGFDYPGTHGSADFNGCSFWGSVSSSS